MVMLWPGCWGFAQMIFPLLWLKLQGVSPKADIFLYYYYFFFADKELLLDQGLEKKGIIMRSGFVSLL